MITSTPDITLESALKPFLMSEITVQTIDQRVILHLRKLYTFFLKNHHIYLCFFSEENNKKKSLEIPYPFKWSLQDPCLSSYNLPHYVDNKTHEIIILDYRISSFKEFYPKQIQIEIQILLDNFIKKYKKPNSLFFDNLLVLSCPKQQNINNSYDSKNVKK